MHKKSMTEQLRAVRNLLAPAVTESWDKPVAIRLWGSCDPSHKVVDDKIIGIQLKSAYTPKDMERLLDDLEKLIKAYAASRKEQRKSMCIVVET